MKREGTIGAAAFLAIAAVVGFTVQTGPKPAESSSANRAATAKRSKPSPTKGTTFEDLPGCSSLREQLEDFLEIPEKKLVLPAQCYEKDDPTQNKTTPNLADKTERLKFVIALLPDPVHTHLPVLFDQFALAIQEGAQDEKYDFDGSWLPWDDEETPYALFLDEKAANREKEFKETQPGIILFRKTVSCGNKEAKEQTEEEKQIDRDALKKCKDDRKKEETFEKLSRGTGRFRSG
jgi:hypothetical protein